MVRSTDYRGSAGQVASGVLRPGDEVVVLPDGERTRIDRIDTFDGPVEEAVPPQSVTVVLADDVDAGRGNLIGAPDDAPPVARRLEARLCWMTDAPATPGARYVLKHTTRRVRARIESIDARLDVERARGRPRASSSTSTTSAASISTSRRR